MCRSSHFCWNEKSEENIKHIFLYFLYKLKTQRFQISTCFGLACSIKQKAYNEIGKLLFLFIIIIFTYSTTNTSLQNNIINMRVKNNMFE